MLIAGDTLQEKLGFTEDAQNQGDKVGKPSKRSHLCSIDLGAGGCVACINIEAAVQGPISNGGRALGISSILAGSACMPCIEGEPRLGMLLHRLSSMNLYF